MTPEKYAKKKGWEILGKSRGMSHRHFEWKQIDTGIRHHIVIGAGKTKREAEIDLDKIKQRMRRCENGTCQHTLMALQRTA